MMRIVSLLSLLWSLVEVHCQTAPYVTFMGNTVPNHGYVDLSLVGDDPSGSDTVLRCHTDLSTCCSGQQGDHRGDWYFPNDTRLPIPASHQTFTIDESRGEMMVELHRSTATSPVGIYRCDIATNAVHDDSDISVRDTIYVGLYTASGGSYAYNLCILGDKTSSLLGYVMISGGVTFTNLNGSSPQFTLTCISTGGPATTVSWTRDNVDITGEQNETVLHDPVAARYTHTLTVTGRLGGVYTCTVSNNKPSTDSATLTVRG